MILACRYRQPLYQRVKLKNEAIMGEDRKKDRKIESSILLLRSWLKLSL